ncbi:hypothetical protein GGF32_007694, partial [Allomyces javanicus]
MTTSIIYDIIEHIFKHTAADPDLTQDHAKELFKTAATEKGQTDLLEWWRDCGKVD